jgi:hypothetical protein
MRIMLTFIVILMMTTSAFAGGGRSTWQRELQYNGTDANWSNVALSVPDIAAAPATTQVELMTTISSDGWVTTLSQNTFTAIAERGNGFTNLPCGASCVACHEPQACGKEVLKTYRELGSQPNTTLAASKSGGVCKSGKGTVGRAMKIADAASASSTGRTSGQ